MKTREFVLLADADKEHVDKLRSTLKDEDEAIKVVIAHDGREALNAALGVGAFAKVGLDNKPLFVLLDLSLPKLNAHLVLQLLRTIRFRNDVPIIAMASSQDEIFQTESSTIGATEIVLKPVSKNKLRALLRKYRMPGLRKSSVHVFDALT